MGMITQAMIELQALGLSGDDLKAALNRIEAAGITPPQRTKTAERMIRYRARKRNESVTVTSRVTPSESVTKRNESVTKRNDVTMPLSSLSFSEVSKRREKEERKKHTVTPVTPNPARGSRLPADWQPSQKNLADARSIGITDQELAIEPAKFRDHWIAVPGQKGVKLDWDAAWRTWCRNVVSWRKADRHQTTQNSDIWRSPKIPGSPII